MSSFFDAMFGSAAPYLMNAFGTPTSVTIVLNGVTIADQIDGIIRHRSTEDFFDGEVERKEEKLEVDILRDDTLSFGGLADDYNNAQAIVDGLTWEVDNFRNITVTWARVGLVRSVARSAHTSGRYRG